MRLENGGRVHQGAGHTHYIPPVPTTAQLERHRRAQEQLDGRDRRGANTRGGLFQAVRRALRGPFSRHRRDGTR